jgi:hypothetical protein
MSAQRKPEAVSGAAGTAPVPFRPGRNWRRWLLVGAAGIVAAVVAAIVGAAVLPRWWSQRVGDQVNGSITTGVLLGIFYGFLLTFASYAVLRLFLARRPPWRWWLVALGVALLVSSPNLITLGIVLGNGNAAHAGDRTLDVEAPGFRGGSLVGAIVAVLAMLALEFLLLTRRRSRREAEHLRRRLQEGEQAAREGSTPPGPESTG